MPQVTFSSFASLMCLTAKKGGHEGAESPQAAVNYFFYLAKCYWPIVAMEMCRRTAQKKNGVHK